MCMLTLLGEKITTVGIVVSPCFTVVSSLHPQPTLSHLALGLSVGTSALIAALLLTVSGVMISKSGGQ